jgi:hypothetical protein
MMPSANRQWRSRVVGAGRQRYRLTLARAKPVQPAICEIRKIEDAKRDCPHPATIFVHAGAHVEQLRHEVSRTCACPTRAHYDVATLLLWSCIQPVSNLPIEAHFPDKLIDCVTMRSDVIGDFQDP